MRFLTILATIFVVVVLFVICGPRGTEWSIFYGVGTLFIVALELGGYGKKFRLWAYGFDPDEELVAWWREWRESHRK